MSSIVIFERFAESKAEIRAADSMGNLSDLDVEAGLAVPAITTAATGYGREFDPTLGSGLRAGDVVPGSTLLTRNASVRAVLRWDLAAQNTYGAAGSLYARGKGTALAEYLSAGVELRVINAALGIGEIRWLWQDSAGNLKTQIGAHFAPPASGYLVLTATRRWISSSSVVLRYYLGDVLLGEVPSVDGSIGGGTTATSSIGTRYTGAAWGRFFAGVLDELQVLDYELTQEEVSATWRRITRDQPNGYQLVRELHPPGFPISADPDSRVQRETNLWGQALGYAAAQAENVRDNVLPDRAFGKVLERWESIVAQPVKPDDSTDTRRARVVGRMRQRAGVSIPGVKEALGELVATAVDNLEVLAFPQEVVELYDEGEVWTADPPAQWTASAADVRVQAAAAANLVIELGTRNWYSMRQSVSSSPQYKVADGNPAEGFGAHLLSKIAPTTIPSRGEVGIAMWDAARQHGLLFGLRNNAGTYQLVTERIVDGVPQGATVRSATTLVPHWLHLFSQAPAPWQDTGTIDASSWLFTAAWSTTSAIAGFTSYAGIAHNARFQWATLYARSFDIAGTKTLAGGLDALFDDTRLWTPYGDRSLRFFVYRDPALAGEPDILGAHGVIQGLKQAHTEATVITSTSVLYDTDGHGYDRGPLGGF